MNVADFIIIVLMLFNLYLSFQSGFFKQINDLVVLIITSLCSCLLADLLITYVLKFVPFFNFIGTTQGIKSINIVLWRIILYLLIISLLIFIIRKIYVKTRLEEKINNTIVEANIISKIGGIIISIPLIMLLYFNIILVLLSPNFNIKYLNNSSVAKFVMKKTPVFSKLNKNLYENESFVINLLNEEEITEENFEEINSQIIENYKETNLVDDDLLDDLDSKLLGTRTDKKEEEKEESDDFDEEGSEDEDYDEEDYEDEDYEDEDWSEDDWSEDDWSEDDWSEDDWSEDDWSEEEWEEDWSEEDWSEEEW